MPTSPTIIPSATRSYEKLAREYRWRVPERFNIAEAICERHARATPDAPAIIEDDPGGSHRITSFAQLKDLSDRIASGLSRLGITRGERVAVTLEQGVDTLAVHLACFKLGAISVPIASLYGTQGLAYRIDDCSARVIVTDAVGAAKLVPPNRPASLAHIVVVGDTHSEGTIPFSELTAAEGPEVGCADSAAADAALLFYTSGTTGPAKGALHAHRVLIGHLPGFQMVFDLAPRPGDVFWTPSAWSWVASLVEVVFPALYFGHPVVATSEHFSIQGAYRVLAEHKVTCPFLAPAALRRMRAEPPDPTMRFTLRAIMTGGEVSPPEVLEWARGTLGATVNDIYGQTEANHVASGCAALFETPHGAIGRIIVGRRARIIDTEGREVGPGKSGEIAHWKEDPIVMLGYWERPEKTAEKFADGWIRTGDTGFIDERGFLHFQGRLDDMIMAGGYRIGPEEVEGALLAHDAVVEAGVVGLPDPERGEIVAACVRLKPGFDPSDALAGELQVFVKERLAAHARPRRVEFVDSLPATSSGKTQRSELRRLLLGGEGS
jgi:acetyl-CoA synthetase